MQKFFTKFGGIILYFVGIFCFGTAFVAFTKADEPSDLKQQVRKLVRQLDADTLKEWQEAETRLVGLGPDVLPLLKPYLDDEKTSENARGYLRKVQQALELASAKADAEAKTITLADDAMPLSKILEAFKLQTGNAIIDSRKKFGQDLPDPKIKVSFDKTPFWQALDRVLDDAQLTVYPFSGEDGVAIISRPETARPRVESAVYRGPFRFEATKVTAERNLQNGKSGMLRLAFQVEWEPRLSPVSVRQSLDKIKAVDDRGRPIEVLGNGDQDVLLSTKATASNLDAPLALPSRDAKSIASLKSLITVLVLGANEEFTFENLAMAKNKALKKGDVTVTLRQVRKNNELWEVLLQVTLSKSAKGVESHTNWIARNEALLIGADKKPVMPAATESSQEDDNVVGLAYLYAGIKSLDGCTLVYRSPTAVRELPVEFEFKNLELP